MNQNTTIETIREAIAEITSLVNSAPHPDIVYTGELREIRTKLRDLANRLEAAPKEKPEFRPIPTKYEVAWEELQERLYRGVDCEAIEIMDEVSKRWLTPADPQQSKEQPPVEQSEQKSGVWIDGEWREIHVGYECPACGATLHGGNDPCRLAGRSICFEGTHLWIEPAPPAVIEPEPELDEFELELREWQANDDKDVAILERVIGLYREIVTRKGDK